MLTIWLLTCIFEVINLVTKGLSVLDITRVLVVFFIFAIPISMIILKLGQNLIKKDFSGTKFKLIIGLSMAWIVVSAYIINYYLWAILKLVKNFV